MLQSITIENFRGFSKLTIEPFSRFNLIGGKNNSGKTALLEAIHLLNNPGEAKLPVEINKGRGFEEPRDLVDICGWLFYRRQTTSGLRMASRDEKGTVCTLSMWIVDADQARERFPEADKMVTTSLNPSFGLVSLPRLIMKFEQPNEPERVSIAVAGSAGGSASAIYINTRVPSSRASILLSSGMAPPSQDLRFFGELEASKRQAEILPEIGREH